MRSGGLNERRDMVRIAGVIVVEEREELAGNRIDADVRCLRARQRAAALHEAN